MAAWDGLPDGMDKFRIPKAVVFHNQCRDGLEKRTTALPNSRISRNRTSRQSSSMTACPVASDRPWCSDRYTVSDTNKQTRFDLRANDAARRLQRR